MIISQHSGEGKANQYYLRGFNLDHGTDFTTTVAGVPVNMPTHAHGHGYSDLNFLIPELVSGVQFRKGPYFADEGDFATAGAAHIRYVNALDRPIVRVSGGEDGWGRILAAASPQAGAGRLLVATELNHNDGPWMRGDDYRRLNGVVRYSVGDTLNAWSLTAMGYGGSWQSTDQAPQRAIDAGALARFDSVDDTTGGETSRVSLSGDWQRTTSNGATRGSAYVMRYQLDLFSNFTYLLDDPVNGDQFQQSDRRIVSGGRLSHRRVSRLGGRPSELLVGADLRHDAIGRLALLHTARREPLAVTRADQVSQTSVSGYVQHEVQWTPWMRSSAGLRLIASSSTWTRGSREQRYRRQGSGEPEGLAHPRPLARGRAVRQCRLWVPLERRAGHDPDGGSRDRRARRSRHAPGPGPRRGVRRANGAATRPRDGRRRLAAGPGRRAAVRRRCRDDGAIPPEPPMGRGVEHLRGAAVVADLRCGPRVVARALHGRGSGGRSDSRRG